MEENTNKQEKRNREFTHLHVHTEYSLLDGSAKINELVDRAYELGMKSLAVTDHGVMYGAIEFYKKAVEKGINPIIGCEVYVAPKSRFDKDNSSSFNYYHLVLLAENNEGYQNLIKIVSYGFTEGFYYKPRVDTELLKKYSKGIIATSACLAGPVARNLLQVSYEKGKEIALEYESIFGKGNFFLELQDHGIKEQKIVNEQIIKIHNETGIALICTNDSHYIYKEDSKAHDILLCIQTGKTVNDDNRMKYEGSEFYFKSAEEMYELFSYVPEAIENTNKIAQRCKVTFKFHELKLPKFDVPNGKNAYEYLRELCYEGFNKKYNNPSSDLKNRLEYELSTIESMGYVDYFLIVWDFIKYSKDNGIIVGPGRGSAAGSLVSYCLSITTIDPIKYDLIFERFLNPERVSMPDIDVDFCYERRQEVIDYVKQKYGEDHVAQIITFGTMAARAAIKDVGRALDMPYSEVDRVSKMIPFELGITIEKALKLNPELANLYETEDEVKNLIDMALRLEGLPRHASTHAAGVVICREPVMEYVPLNTNDGAVTTQYNMTILEELGILKMDFLGLRTLTVIQNAVKEVYRNYNILLDLENINYEDEKVYELIAQGKTEGVFQLESSGMKVFMKELHPTRLEDLIAGISLYRPGPMDFIPKYIRGKNNPNEIVYTHEKLKPILNTTYGCIVYQEQVMQIVRDLAGYSLGRSDLVRRAMSKKKASVMAEERKNFVFGVDESVPGCVKNGIPEEIAEKIFDEMTDFAKYAFNKSHAAAYAVVGYQTAWLKTYYPVEFMAALMTSVMDNTDKVSGYIEECKKMNIDLLPPDINKSFAHFSVYDGKIRFGLAAIKNVGKNAINAIVSERNENGEFNSLTEFCNRLQGGELNKKCIESFIKSGAFDCFGGKRAQYMNVYKNILDSITYTKKTNLEGQLNLFDLNEDKDTNSMQDILPDIKEFSTKEMLNMEKEVLSIYISGHPLAEYEPILKRRISITSIEINGNDENIESNGIDSENSDNSKAENGQSVIMGGIIADKSIKYTKNNKPMAFIKLEDLKGTIEVIVFPKDYEKYLNLLFIENVVIVEGRISTSENENAKVIASNISAIKPSDNSDKKLGLILGKNNSVSLNDIIPILNEFKGNTPVYINDLNSGKKFKAAQSSWINLESDIEVRLKKILGEDCVIVK